jgi:hypothetical protein
MELNTRHRTYRRVRDYADTCSPHGCLAARTNDPEREARIQAHMARIQAELPHHPQESPLREARAQAAADRAAIAAYLAEHGGTAPRRWISFDLGWHYTRVERAIKLGCWFVRSKGEVSLTSSGWKFHNERRQEIC